MDHDELLDRIRQALLDGSLTAEELDQLKPTKPLGRPSTKAHPPESTRKRGGQPKHEKRILFEILWPILSTAFGKQRAKERLVDLLNYADMRTVEKHRAWFERRHSERGLQIFDIDLPNGEKGFLHLDSRQAKIFRRRLARGETSLTRLTRGFCLESIIDLPMNTRKIE